MSIVAQVGGLIDEAGESITYKRISSSAYNASTLAVTRTEQSYDIKAAVRDYTPREIAGLVLQGDKKVRIAAASLSFTPTVGDFIVQGGASYRVVSVNTRNPFDEATLHILQIRGG